MHIKNDKRCTTWSDKIRYSWLLLFLRINADLAIFKQYLDLEAGDNQSLKIQAARPGIEPRSSCFASQKLNHSATAAPKSDTVDCWIIYYNVKQLYNI